MEKHSEMSLTVVNQHTKKAHVFNFEAKTGTSSSSTRTVLKILKKCLYDSGHFIKCEACNKPIQKTLERTKCSVCSETSGDLYE